MRYLFEKNNSWFCYSTLLTQQTIRREGSLWKPLPFQRDLFSQQKSLSLYGTFSRHKVKRYVPLCVNGPLCQRHAGGNKELLVPNLHRVCTRNLFVDALAVYLTNLLMSCFKLLANSQFNFCKSIVMQRCHQKISNCRECCL